MGGLITDSSQALTSDEARYLDTGDARAFMAVWSRHRDNVCAALEATGLTPSQAEVRINDVFVRMMDSREQIDRSLPLGQSLRELARSVVEGD